MPSKFFKTSETAAAAAVAASSHSPTKLRKVHPVFYLSLDCPLKEVDMTFEPKKIEVEFANWHEVVRFIEDGIHIFLKNNRLLVPTARVNDEPEQPRPPNPSNGG